MTLPTSGRESCNAGEMPNTIAVATASAALNSRTGRFISITDSAGNESVGSHAAINARLRQAISTPERRARQGNRQRFGQQLPDNPPACRSQRRAHRQFMLPLRAARQQQNRHIGAADQQQRRHRAEEQIQRRPHRFRVQIRDAAQIHAEAVGIARRRLFGELFEQRLQFGIRPGRSDARDEF